MSRLHRISSALLLIASLLFTQLAVAAHACPMMLRGTVTASAEQAESMDVMPCHERRDNNTASATALCKAHCTDAERTVSDAFAGHLIAFVAAFIVTTPPLGESPVSSPSEFAPGLSHTLGPPLAITHCCLRI